MSENKYWMVHNPKNRNPHREHQSKQAAVTEAKRLARQNAGEMFFILEAVSCYSAIAPEPSEIELLTPGRIVDCEFVQKKVEHDNHVCPEGIPF